jgi:hypothetical protein
MDNETKTQELLNLIKNFSANHLGTDEIAKVASIKSMPALSRFIEFLVTMDLLMSLILIILMEVVCMIL